MKNDISNKHTFVVCAYKESKYLEACVQSLKRQEYKSRIIIATSTPNDYIREIAGRYALKLYINQNPSSLAGDWNFAMSCCDTELVTIAHQDDLYEPQYSKNIVEYYEKAKDAIILFTDYCELRKGQKVECNRLLKIKRIMLTPLRIHLFWKSKFVRRRILAFGSAICCPAVTMVKKQMPIPLFEDNMKSNIDWQAWELLSREKGQFVFIPQKLMCHRIHEESTTTELLEANSRREEDLLVFRKFWPDWIARIIEKVYQKGEQSNRLDE